MTKDKKILTEKEIVKQIRDLKIELLRSPTKRGRVKKEIARLLTMVRSQVAGRRSQVVGIGATGSKDKLGGTKA